MYFFSRVLYSMHEKLLIYKKTTTKKKKLYDKIQQFITLFCGEIK